MRFFLISQGSLNPNIRFSSKTVISSSQRVTEILTETHTDTKVTTVGTLSGFLEFFLQPIINDRPNSSHKLILFSDYMFDFIERLLDWAVELHPVCNESTKYILLQLPVLV